MPNLAIRKRLKSWDRLSEYTLPGDRQVYTESGTQVPKAKPNGVRQYGKWVYDGDDPYMQKAYEHFCKRPYWKKTQRARKKPKLINAHCVVADWVLRYRSAEQDHCIIVPDIVPGRVQRVKYNYKNMAAARAMLLATQGLPPEGKDLVAHKCGNGHLSCINPKHLYWGDKKDNGRDRTLHHENTPWVEASEATVKAIREAEGMDQIVAWEFRVPVSQVAAYRAA